jgi:tetratricopeptide (TPR) repeat protein
MGQKRDHSSRLGLRVTVRLHGAVVGQAVHWPSRFGPATIGDSPEAVVPTPSGGPLAVARWRQPGVVAIDAREPGAASGAITVGETWRWKGPDGVDVDCDLVPYQRAARFGAIGGDLALLTLMLSLMVGVGQVNMLLKGLMPPAGQAAAGYEASPELIARLLSRDLDGEDQGVVDRADRPDMAKGNPSFYMPAGNDGPLHRIGGGAEAGDEVQRREDPDREEALAAGDADDAPTVDAAAPELDPLGAQDDGIAQIDPAPALADGGQAGARTPMERFIGWGFRDWFDAADSRTLDPEMQRQLDRARSRLRIDPDDPAAIQVLGYYSYLAEQTEVCRDAYRRYTELYPDDPAGFNNLALTYKRTGDYATEEALYRKALALDPLDAHVINNLAVNLAHQGRGAEALALMDQLEELTPDDPYADLHRAKIYATMDKRERSYRALARALEGVAALDTLHHIEFRQDIRLDPAFDEMRGEARFRRLLERFYDDADALLAGPDGKSRMAAEGSRG